MKHAAQGMNVATADRTVGATVAIKTFTREVMALGLPIRIFPTRIGLHICLTLGVSVS